MKTLSLKNIRREYASRQLQRGDMPPNPIELLTQWLDEALQEKVNEPTAMLLATATLDARPSMRTVLLKELMGEQLVFYSNYKSRKGQQLDENPHVAASFLWHELERQIHIEGRVERVPPEMSDAYFAERSYKSRIGARVSPQSRPIPSRESIMANFAVEALRWVGQSVPRPEDWGGWAITIERIEFWQGRESRLHDRFLYTKIGEGWRLERLAP